MKIIKVEIPEGYEADGFDQTTSELKLRPKGVKRGTEILTVADLLAANGTTQEHFDQQCTGLEPDEKAYRLLKLLVSALNEGWTPDWTNSSEYKYVPWFWMDHGGSSGFRFGVDDGWGSGSGVGSRLCFRTRELAVHAGTHFLDVYKSFMTIE